MRSFRLWCCDLAVVLIGLSWLASLASAQTIQSRAASVGAPRSISTAIAARAVPPPNPRQFAAEKQQRINDHFRPTIELVEAAGIRAQALPQVPPTVVKAAPVQAATGLRFFTNRGLTDAETSGVTSTVCEPSVAARGQEILVTGNWFAAFSKNGGATFQYVNPDTTFPAAGNGKRFCCDQVAIYDPKHDVMCWYLQYINDATGNTGRLAVARGADIAAQSWRYYDFTPQSVGQWTGEWFDFPDLALSGGHLFITTNAFSASDAYRRSVVLRLPLADLANYRALNYRFFDTNQVASIRPAQGATDTMYLAAHRNLSSLRFFSWPDSSLSIGQVDVAVQSWSDATGVAPGPDGKDWLGARTGGSRPQPSPGPTSPSPGRPPRIPLAGFRMSKWP